MKSTEGLLTSNSYLGRAMNDELLGLSYNLLMNQNMRISVRIHNRNVRALMPQRLLSFFSRLWLSLILQFQFGS